VIEEVQLFDVSLEDAEELVNEVEAGRRCPIGRVVHEDDADAAAIQLEDPFLSMRSANARYHPTACRLFSRKINWLKPDLC
jgi:hypothetical protein